MDNESISVSDAAAKLGIQKQSLFKVIKRFGLSTIKQKSSSHRGQSIAYITQTDFDFIVNNYTVEKRHQMTLSQPTHLYKAITVFFI